MHALKSVDRSQARLRQLENAGKPDGTMELSQKEYTDHIEKLHDALQRAWANDERVRALKLAIQCAKLLGETTVPQFYPSMFVMITEILDTFGALVFARIKAKAQESRGSAPISDDFASSSEISIDAKETCRNWFYKTACIRELLPRLYIEIALIRCYRFLSDNEFPQILARLGSIIRGVGDPLVAVYARCYLARGGASVQPQLKSYAVTMLYDYLFSFQEFRQAKFASITEKLKLSEADYLHLHAPAVEWLLKCIGQNASRDIFTTVLQHYRDYCSNSMVLKNIIDAFDPSHYSQNSIALVALVKQAEPSKTSTVQVLESVGMRLLSCPPPDEQRLTVLNEVWKVVTRCDDLPTYIACASAWLDVLLRHYSEREVLILLRDVVRHVEVAEMAHLELSMRNLEQLVTVLVQRSTSFGGVLLTSEYMLKLLDVLKPSRKVEISKDLLDAFARTHKPTNDPILIHTVFDIARTVHDAIDSLSPEGEQRHISSLICGFINKVECGQDLEQQLNIYVECRAAFSNLDPVKDRLIIAVAALAMKAHRFLKARHTKKTSAFVKACLAYCHITIPSIDDVFRRLHLLLFCGNVALLNQCLPQTDTFLKAAITLIPDVPPMEEFEYKRKHTEARLASFLKGFWSTLVVVPGHPDYGPFYLVQGLLNAIPRYPWQSHTGVLTSLYIHMLPLLCAYTQRKLPYAIERVESNDVLYGGSAEYMTELREHFATVVQAIVEQLTALGEEAKSTGRPGGPAEAQRLFLVLDLVNQLLNLVQLDEGVAKFVYKLLELASSKKDTMDAQTKQYWKNTLELLRGMDLADAHPGLQALASTPA